jgi:hypothetical protein
LASCNTPRGGAGKPHARPWLHGRAPGCLRAARSPAGTRPGRATRCDRTHRPARARRGTCCAWVSSCAPDRVCRESAWRAHTPRPARAKRHLATGHPPGGSSVRTTPARCRWASWSDPGDPGAAATAGWARPASDRGADLGGGCAWAVAYPRVDARQTCGIVGAFLEAPGGRRVSWVTRGYPLCGNDGGGRWRHGRTQAGSAGVGSWNGAVRRREGSSRGAWSRWERRARRRPPRAGGRAGYRSARSSGSSRRRAPSAGACSTSSLSGTTSARSRGRWGSPSRPASRSTATSSSSRSPTAGRS